MIQYELFQVKQWSLRLAVQRVWESTSRRVRALACDLDEVLHALCTLQTDSHLWESGHFHMSNNLGSLLIDGCRSGVRPYLSREVDTSVRTSQVFIQVVMDTEEGQMSCEVT
ncbi:hypothetical protein PO909_027212 [Leuciscus waleckii]